MRRASTVLVVLGSLASCSWISDSSGPAPETVLSTGRAITPLDAGVPVGGFPVNMKLSPDGKWLIVTDSGYRQQLSVIDPKDGHLVSKMDFNKAKPQKDSLYFGMAFDPAGRLYVSRGGEDLITVLRITPSGQLEAIRDISNKPTDGAKIPNFVSGLALSGTSLFAVNNQTHAGTNLQGSVSEIDAESGRPVRTFKTPGFPFDILVTNGRAFVSSERDACVSAINLSDGSSSSIPTGANATCMLMTSRGIAVSNSGSDTVSFLDPASGQVIRTVLLRPAETRGLPGVTPLGLAEANGALFVACADLNAVAVVDLDKFELRGLLPVGWYPTAVAASADGKRLFVANGKGSKAVNPNGRKVGNLGTYILNILEGTVSMLDLTKSMRDLAASTREVLANNRLGEDRERRVRSAFKNPGIKHVVYILKENRTYDNVLGDLAGGNGDASICLFPREVTPNQHALAERFVLLDNFHVCAEVSADGWNWSTSGMVGEYTVRNSIYNYSGRGRDYDFEGRSNGVVNDFAGVADVAAAPGGYLWDAAIKAKVTLRNYGFFVGEVEALGARSEGIEDATNAPTKRALVPVTNSNFRQYDLAYADSEAHLRYGFKEPRGLATFGKFRSPSRFSEWKREFDQQIASGKMPALTLLRLPRNHTSGTAAGRCSPRAMVADNDYAVGQVVEAVSKSPYWKSTAIFIIEDDAQAGMDHVDCHRSTCYVVSPFIRRSTHEQRFFNTDSVLRTMELLLGIKPMNAYDATADAMDFFGKEASNAEPFEAILPPKEIVTEVNKPTAYRAKDSERLIGRFGEESLPDLELNDILWHSIKRGQAPRPRR